MGLQRGTVRATSLASQFRRDRAHVRPVAQSLAQGRRVVGVQSNVCVPSGGVRGERKGDCAHKQPEDTPEGKQRVADDGVRATREPRDPGYETTRLGRPVALRRHDSEGTGAPLANG